MPTLDALSVTFSVVSSVCCSFLIYSYLRYPSLRAFPSNMVLWRAVADLVFSLQTLVLTCYNLSTESDPSARLCMPFNFFRQFAMSASLGWFFVLTHNYWKSVSNPFVNPRTRNRYYHCYVWAFSLITACVSAKNSAWRQRFHLCYTEKTSGVNWLNWGTFTFWVLAYWLFSIITMAYTIRTVRGGSYRSTISSRQQMLRLSSTNIVVFTLFWTGVGVVYFLIYLKEEGEHDALEENTSEDALYRAFAALISSLGMADFVVWILTQREAYFNSKLHASVSDTLSRTSSSRKKKKLRGHDLSSSLRQEFIFFTSKGIQDSVLWYIQRLRRLNRYYTHVSPNASPNHKSKSISMQRARRGSVAVADIDDIDIDIPPPLEYQPGHDTVLFQDYSPAIFEELRSQVFNCNHEEYLTDLLGERRQDDIQVMKETFSEGRSGSFLYFSPSARFIVKTLSSSEHSELLKMLLPYFKHLKAHPFDAAAGRRGMKNSLLARIFGMYSIRMYGHTQYFCVMENVLWSPQAVPIHERYDLKGSWRDRHVDPLAAPSEVRKDNDFRYSLHVERDIAKQLLIQALRDCYFMYSMNIMDYSLLVGVHRCIERRRFDSHCNGVEPAGDHSRASVSWPGKPKVGGQAADPRDRTGAVGNSSQESGTESDDPHSQRVKMYLSADLEQKLLDEDPPAGDESSILQDPPTTHADTDTAATLSATDSPAASKVSKRHSTGDNSSGSGANGTPRGYATAPGTATGTAYEASGVDSESKTQEDDSRLRRRRKSKKKKRKKGSRRQRLTYGGVDAEMIEGPGIFFFGIIDLLQSWNFSKKFEHYWKRIFRGYEKYSMSAIPPKHYAERFLLMLREHLQVSLMVLGGQPGVILSIADHTEAAETDDGVDAYLVHLEYRGELVVEHWETEEELVSSGYEHAANMLANYRVDSRLLKYSDFGRTHYQSTDSGSSARRSNGGRPRDQRRRSSQRRTGKAQLGRTRGGRSAQPDEDDLQRQHLLADDSPSGMSSGAVVVPLRGGVGGSHSSSGSASRRRRDERRRSSRGSVGQVSTYGATQSRLRGRLQQQQERALLSQQQQTQQTQQPPQQQQQHQQQHQQQQD